MRNKQAITPYYGMALIALLMIFAFGCTNISGSDVESKKIALSEKEMETSVKTVKSASDAGVSKDSGIQDSGTDPQMDGGTSAQKLFSDELIVLDEKSEEAKVIKKFYSGPEVKRWRVVKVNLDALKSKNLMVNFFGDLNIGIGRYKYKSENIRTGSWFGNIKDSYTSAVFTVLDGYVHGSVWVFTEQYWIRSISEDYHIVLDIDESKLKEHESHMDENSSYIRKHDASVASDKKEKIVKSGSKSSGEITRILIVFANNAKAWVETQLPTGQNSMELQARTYIDEMNLALDNSDVTHDVELARVYKTNYSESTSYVTDRNQFMDPDDDIMDEIHDIREYVGADICVLMRQNDAGPPGGCAAVIGAEDADEAFASATASWGALHVAHEVGHLFWCRHDPADDPNGTYNHGYKNEGPTLPCHKPGNPFVAANPYRTIMATACDAGCPKIIYYSNVTQTPCNCIVGVIGVANNALAINNWAPDIEDFYLLPSWIYLADDDEIKEDEYVFYQATGSISNYQPPSYYNDFTVKSGGRAYFEADSITFAKGFHAESGSHVHAGEDIDKYEDEN